MLDTPVLFLIFNRPDTTAQVFEAIRKAKPKKFYIAADGPRIEKKGEAELCEETKRIVGTIDWDCDVKTLYRDENLGCKIAVKSAIDWLFKNEEMGIILEDDCLPSPDFFAFCEVLLGKYKFDERIGHISGSNHGITSEFNEDYYFSNLTHIWGWATWKRSWENFQLELFDWSIFRKKFNLNYVIEPEYDAPRREILYDKLLTESIDTWDFSWGFHNLKNHHLSIIPNKSLIINIGFDDNASRTTNIPAHYKNVVIKKMHFPIVHPKFIVPSMNLDKEYCKLVYPQNESNKNDQTTLNKLKNKLISLLK